MIVIEKKKAMGRSKLRRLKYMPAMTEKISIVFSYLLSSFQTKLIDEQFFEFVVDIFSL